MHKNNYLITENKVVTGKSQSEALPAEIQDFPVTNVYGTNNKNKDVFLITFCFVFESA